MTPQVHGVRVHRQFDSRICPSVGFGDLGEGLSSGVVESVVAMVSMVPMDGKVVV